MVFNALQSLETIKLDKKYKQIIIDKNKIYDEAQYEMEITSPSNINENTCVTFNYKFTDENINNLEFENTYNNLWVTQKNNKINWAPIKNVNKYEIYIFNEFQNSLNNDCYLQSIKNNNNSPATIIETNNAYYEFEDKSQKFYITIVGYENNYGMRIVYNSIYYTLDKGLGTGIILLIVFSSILVVGLLIFLICRYKKKHSNNNNYNINDINEPIVNELDLKDYNSTY